MIGRAQRQERPVIDSVVSNDVPAIALLRSPVADRTGISEGAWRKMARESPMPAEIESCFVNNIPWNQSREI
jgi:hypothetical protein